MLRILAVVGAVLVVLVLGLIGFAATKPDSFRVARSTVIAAPPEKIAAQVNDFHAWRAWSPYERLDPDMKRTYGGSTNGPGATYAYDGSNKVGAGRMEIRETTPAKTVLSLDFIRPMKTSNVSTFLYEPQGAQTKVTWQMDGPMPLMAKVMGLFFSMDQLVGKDFEAGLAALKTVSER